MMKKDQKCPSCGCSDVLMNVKIVDRGHNDLHRELCVVVEANPEAFIFKERYYGVMRACICADCGFTEIYTENARELYEETQPSSSK
jgi:predicted nucleic-acid-binding Zn-ribbon protein